MTDSPTKIGQKINGLTRLLLRPSLIALRSRGVSMDTFLELDQLWFRNFNFQTVLDIGANIGQFALTVNAVIPQANIYSFEPLPDCFAKLKENHKFIKNFTPINVGVGNQSGNLLFERSSFDVSSSFLKMGDIHKNAFPQSQGSTSIEVKIEKLDTLCLNLGLDLNSDSSLKAPLLIKIDVQGYEDRVLLGGEKTIKQAKLIIIETSYVNLYDEQCLFNNAYEILREYGFSYAGSLDKVRDPKTGQILQEDSLFIK